MKKHFADFKATKEKTSKKKIEIDRQATQPPSYHPRESKEASIIDDDEGKTTTACMLEQRKFSYKQWKH